jgi:hypothetical protein
MFLAGKFDPSFERITRIFNIIPFDLAITVPLVFAFDKRLGHTFFKSGVVRVLLVVFCIFLAGWFIKEAPGRLTKIQYTKTYSLSQLDKNAQLYGLIREKIPAGSTVMMNAGMTTWWTTYFPHYIVAHAFEFVLPPNMDQRERASDVKSFFESSLTDKSIDILKKYKVNYVFILPNELQNKDFKKYKVFEPVETNPSFSIYKVLF